MMAYPEKGAMPLQWSSLGVIQVVPSGQHPMLDTTIIQTHPTCLKIHRHQEHYGHDSKKGVYGYMDVEIGCEWGNLILPSASFSLTGTKGYNIILDPYDNLTLFLTL